jgi:hypothetical protein
VTPVISRETVEALRSQIEEGYAGHGVLHRLLEQWGRVDHTAIPGTGQTITADAMPLDRAIDDVTHRSTVHLDLIGLQFAQAEVAAYFAAPFQEVQVAPGPALGEAVHKAVRASRAYGADAAVWVNLEDEYTGERAGAYIDPQPELLRDGRWHGARVVLTSLLPAGAIWVTAQEAGLLSYDGGGDPEHPIEVHVIRGEPHDLLQATLRFSVKRGARNALVKIVLIRG